MYVDIYVFGAAITQKTNNQIIERFDIAPFELEQI